LSPPAQGLRSRQRGHTKGKYHRSETQRKETGNEEQKQYSGQAVAVARQYSGQEDYRSESAAKKQKMKNRSSTVASFRGGDVE